MSLQPPEHIDRLLSWEPGRTRKLVRRGKLPHYRLPDGEIRLDPVEVLALVRYVGIKSAEVHHA